MNIEQLNQHYLYIAQNNDLVKNPFFWCNYKKNDKIHFKNALRALKTNKNLEFKLKREWMICKERKRILKIEFLGIYKEFWQDPTSGNLKKYNNLFI